MGPIAMLFVILILAATAVTSPQFQARVAEGVAALNRNDLTEAQASLEQATQLEPADPGAWLLLAQTYGKQKNQKFAVAAAEKAEALAGTNGAILQGLANFYATVVPDYGKAAALGTRYAETNSHDAMVWRRLTQFCLSTGQTDQAITAATKGLASDNSAELHTLLGTAYSGHRHWPKAIAEFKTAIEISPYYEDAHFRLAQAYLLQQNFPSAISVLENARRTFDKSPQIELALGVAYYGQRRFTDAVDEFLKTTRLAPDVPQSYYFLGRLLDHAGDRIPEVTESFLQFKKRHPESYLGYLLHAKVLIEELPATGYPTEAVQAFELLQKSLTLKEDVADTHYLIGVLLERKSEYNQAAKHLERSAAINATDSAVHFRLARVYERLGRKDDARAQRDLHKKLSDTQNSVTGPGLEPLRP